MHNKSSLMKIIKANEIQAKQVTDLINDLKKIFESAIFRT
jgi:hypothetical protein